MTEHKAAALTSSLFARKGTASPASLLIADLEASGLMNGAEKAGSDGKAQAEPQARRGAEGDAGLGIDLGHQQIPVAALNGTAGRRKTPAAEPELPLLALVDAQSASESDAAPVKGTAADSAGDPGVGRKPATASKPAAGASPAGQDDLSPAASLLDSGAQALQRVNGQAAACATANADPLGAEADGEVAAEVSAQTLEHEDSTASGPTAADSTVADSTAADLAAPETVSGDDRITAIEDAPDEHAGDLDAAPEAAPAAEITVEAEDEAVPEAVPAQIAALPDGEAPDIKALENLAPRPATNDVRTDDATPPPAPAKAMEATAAAVPATHGLRQGTARRPDGPVPVAASAVAMAETPASRLSVLPWKRAAVAALGLALGLGAYVTLSGTPPEAPLEQPLPPTTAPVPEPAQSDVHSDVRSDVPGRPDQLGAAEPASAAEDTPAAATEGGVPAVAPVPTETAAAAAAPPPAVPEPSFDIIRIEPNGQSIIAGRALPLSEWILLNNGEPIASIRADGNGEWVVLPDATLVPGANAFSLVPKAEQGRVAIPAPNAGAATPGATNSTVPGPRASNPGAAVPAEAEGLEATPPGPRSEAVQEPGDSQVAFTLPKPKPERALEVVQTTEVAVSPRGAYEVQFASVRQISDAERERYRLVEAFPILLGSLELRVQQASVEGAGTFYRVRSGTVDDLGSAREVCRQMKAAGQACLVVRRAPQKVVPKAQNELVLEPVLQRPSARQQAERPR